MERKLLGPGSSKSNTHSDSNTRSVHSWIKLEEAEQLDSANADEPNGQVWRQGRDGSAEPRWHTEGGRTIHFVTAQETSAAWRRLGQERSLDDSQLAALLLQCYEDAIQQNACSSCRSPLTHFCSKCFVLVPSAEKEQVPRTSTASDRSEGQGCSGNGDSFYMELQDSTHENLAPLGGADEQSKSPAEVKDDAREDNCGRESAVDGDDAGDSASVDASGGDVPMLGGDGPGHGGTGGDGPGHGGTVGDGPGRGGTGGDGPGHGGTGGDGPGGGGTGGKHLVVCAWCDVSFPSIQDMARHLAVHSSRRWQQLQRPSPHRASRRERARAPRYNDEEEDEEEESVVMSQEAAEENGSGRSKSYKCVYCGSSFKKTLSLTKHLQKHFKTYAFKCCDCQSAFESLKELETHVHTFPHDFVQNDGGGKSSDDNRPHQCRICGMRFRYLGFLANHAARHTEPNPFWCSHCQHGFQFLSDLTGHKCRSVGEEHAEEAQTFQGFASSGISLERVQGEDQSFPGCKSSTFQCSAESKAVEEIHEERCSTPGKEASHSGDSADSITQPPQKSCATKEVAGDTAEPEAGPRERSRGSVPRLRVSKKDQPFQCPDCPSAFKYASGLKIHCQKHTGRNAFPCPQCQRSFPSKARMLAHQEKDHWGSTPFTCHHCGKVLKSMLLLDQHLRCHTGELPFQCRTCRQSFKSHTALSVHRRCHKEDCFRCRECGASFQDHSAYKLHMDEHAGVKPHLCSVCGAAFPQRTQLKRHMVRHGRKQVVCEHCGRAFFTNGEYRIHEMRHLGIKPFACQHCDMSFVQRGKLTRHHRSVHLRVKLFKCGLCPAAYSDTSRLNEHVRASHTNERPYKCPVCGKAFAKSGCRQAHLRIHKREANGLG